MHFSGISLPPTRSSRLFPKTVINLAGEHVLVTTNRKVFRTRLWSFPPIRLALGQLAGLLHFPIAVGTARGNPLRYFGIGISLASMRASVRDNFLHHIPLFFLAPSPVPRSFLSASRTARWFMLLVWLWHTLGFALGNGIVPGLKNVFDGRVRCSPMKEVTKCHIERRERRSFYPPHVAGHVPLRAPSYYVSAECLNSELARGTSRGVGVVSFYLDVSSWTERISSRCPISRVSEYRFEFQRDLNLNKPVEN